MKKTRSSKRFNFENVNEKSVEENETMTPAKRRISSRASTSIATPLNRLFLNEEILSPELIPLPDSPVIDKNDESRKMNETFSPVSDEIVFSKEVLKNSAQKDLQQNNLKENLSPNVKKVVAGRKIATPGKSKSSKKATPAKKSPEPLIKSIRKTRARTELCLSEKKNVTFYSPANMEMSTLDIDLIMKSELKPKTLRKRSISIAETENEKKQIQQNEPSPKKRAKSSTPSSRVKIPNFSEIHRRNFEKMESIDEHANRKRERAKKLLQSSKKSPKSQNKNNLSLKESEEDKKIEEEQKLSATKAKSSLKLIDAVEETSDKNLVDTKPEKKVSKLLRGKSLNLSVEINNESIVKVNEDKKVDSTKGKSPGRPRKTPLKFIDADDESENKKINEAQKLSVKKGKSPGRPRKSSLKFIDADDDTIEKDSVAIVSKDPVKKASKTLRGKSLNLSVDDQNGANLEEKLNSEIPEIFENIVEVEKSDRRSKSQSLVEIASEIIKSSAEFESEKNLMVFDTPKINETEKNSKSLKKSIQKRNTLEKDLMQDNKNQESLKKMQKNRRKTIGTPHMDKFIDFNFSKKNESSVQVFNFNGIPDNQDSTVSQSSEDTGQIESMEQEIDLNINQNSEEKLESTEILSIIVEPNNEEINVDDNKKSEQNFSDEIFEISDSNNSEQEQKNLSTDISEIIKANENQQAQLNITNDSALVEQNIQKVESISNTETITVSSEKIVTDCISNQSINNDKITPKRKFEEIVDLTTPFPDNKNNEQLNVSTEQTPKRRRISMTPIKPTIENGNKDKLNEKIALQKTKIIPQTPKSTTKVNKTELVKTPITNKTPKIEKIDKTKFVSFDKATPKKLTKIELNKTLLNSAKKIIKETPKKIGESSQTPRGAHVTQRPKTATISPIRKVAIVKPSTLKDKTLEQSKNPFNYTIGPATINETLTAAPQNDNSKHNQTVQERRMAMYKCRSAPSKLTQNPKILRGVRTNRRFELQMKFRDSNNKKD